MSIIAWVIFGAIAGWVAAKLAGTDDDSGCITNIVIGVIGAFVGGALYQFTTGNDWDFGFNLGSFLLAIVGAVAFLFILRAIRR